MSDGAAIIGRASTALEKLSCGASCAESFWSNGGSLDDI